MAEPALVFYDSQCEICQAGVAWIHLLDRRRRTRCVPLDAPDARRAGLDPEACNRQLHVLAPRGLFVGWPAVCYLARLFPPTWLAGALGALPPFSWAGRRLYGWVAGNRYALSKCRGGACRSLPPVAPAPAAPQAVIRGCYWFGMLLHLPLSLGAIAAQVARNTARFFRTWRRRYQFLGGRLELFVLNGLPCDLVSLLFGEHFVMIRYGAVAIDPGPARLRRALLRHLPRLRAAGLRAVVATHHHEEHSANLNWLAARAGAVPYAAPATAQILASPPRLPRIREFMIGALAPLVEPYSLAETSVGPLQVIPTPGHCADHIVLYDPEEKILFAGDSFMGAYFSAPNPDVDSRAWIDTLRRLLALDIQILIEGHGHIHTLRRDIPADCPLVVRRDPREALAEKLRFCEWVRDQVAAGSAEGLALTAIQATCFPWRRNFSWESFWNDQLSRWFSRGHWSRTELVLSFNRPAGSTAVLPIVYKANMSFAAPFSGASGTSHAPPSIRTCVQLSGGVHENTNDHAGNAAGGGTGDGTIANRPAATAADDAATAAADNAAAAATAGHAAGPANDHAANTTGHAAGCVAGRSGGSTDA